MNSRGTLKLFLSSNVAIVLFLSSERTKRASEVCPFWWTSNDEATTGISLTLLSKGSGGEVAERRMVALARVEDRVLNGQPVLS